MAENKYESLIEDMEEQGRERSGSVAKWAIRFSICAVVFIVLLAAHLFMKSFDTIPFIRDMSPLVSFFAIPLLALGLFVLVVSLLIGSGTALWRLDNPRSKQEKVRIKISRGVRMIIKIDREIEKVEGSDKPEDIKSMVNDRYRKLREEAIQALTSCIEEENLNTSPETLIKQELMRDKLFRKEYLQAEEEYKETLRK